LDKFLSYYASDAVRLPPNEPIVQHAQLKTWLRAQQTDASRIELLNRLVDAGYEQKIMISGDMGRRSYLKAYGGGPGFDFLLTKFVPRLLAEGWDQKLVDRVFVRNPAEYLTYRYCWRHSADYRVRAVGPESSTRSSS